MKFGSVCSGIEAASVAWGPLGWKAAWFSEIEPFPCAVLRHHYPDVPNLGNMTALPAMIRSGQVEVPDLLCGGTPCQAFSVAGLRQSLADERGNLSLTFCEIADAIDEQRKSIIFWENVPGVLSTKDNAFGCFLGALAGEDDALVPPGGRWANAGFIDGPKRAVAWRILDAQYFGVAQRRRRVFVVASARDDFDPAAVLFEFDGVRRDIAPSREAGQEVAGTFTARAKSGGWGQDPNLAAGGYMQPVAPTVTNGPPFSRTGNERVECEAVIAQCVTTGTGRRYDPETETETILAMVAPTLDQRAGRSGANSFATSGGLVPVAIQDITPREKAQNGKGWNDDGAAYTVDTHATQGVAVAVALRGREGGATAELGDEIQNCLRASQGGGDKPHVLTAMQVRRLTPTECERLQGFPDNYTNIKDKCPDGPRYKALGNSWAVPVVRWIGERIDRALD
jgi:DNA (cytosine-5)-methyltransferase 1